MLTVDSCSKIVSVFDALDRSSSLVQIYTEKAKSNVAIQPLGTISLEEIMLADPLTDKAINFALSGSVARTS